MAKVALFIGLPHEDTLTDGLDVMWNLVTIDGLVGTEFTGPIEELEILLNRYNGDAGQESFTGLLRLIRED